MSVKCQVNVKSQYELDIGGRETCFISGPMNDVMRRLELFYPTRMKEFRRKLCIKYRRSFTPGGLNGPQLTKICREENLTLLCQELGGGIVGKTSAQYLRSLSNLYKLCVR